MQRDGVRGSDPDAQAVYPPHIFGHRPAAHRGAQAQTEFRTISWRRDPDGDPAYSNLRCGSHLLHTFSVEDLCESAVQKPERPFRPAGNPHGLCQPHLRPLDLHPAQKDSGPQADGENQVSVLQNGRKGTKERRSVPLCRRPLLLLHHLQGLTLTGFT